MYRWWRCRRIAFDIVWGKIGILQCCFDDKCSKVLPNLLLQLPGMHKWRLAHQMFNLRLEKMAQQLSTSNLASFWSSSLRQYISLTTRLSSRCCVVYVYKSRCFCLPSSVHRSCCNTNDATMKYFQYQRIAYLENDKIQNEIVSWTSLS